MDIAVIYQSRTGNTKKVAQAIAQALHTAAWEVTEVKDLKCDLLFLGSGVYAASLDKTMKRFLDSLSGTSAKKAVLFGTSAGGKKPFGMMRKALEKKGIPVERRTLFIPGKWAFLNHGRPNEEDLVTAKVWAEGIVSD